MNSMQTRLLAALILGMTTPLSQTFADSLKAEVDRRAAQVEQLTREYEGDLAAWEASDGNTAVSGAKFRFLLQEQSSLIDAQSRQAHAEANLAAEQENLAFATGEIKRTLDASPEARRLTDAAHRATILQDAFADLSRQVRELRAIRLEASKGDADIAKLRALKQRLQERVQTLTGTVAAEHDESVKAHNQAILVRAGAMLTQLDGQIADLEAAAVDGRSRMTALTGEADPAAAASVADSMIAAWNRASRRLRDIEAVPGGLGCLNTSAKVDPNFTGSVSLLSPGGKPRFLKHGEAPDLQPGDRILTGGNSHIELTLEDGGRMVFGENSDFLYTGTPKDPSSPACVLKAGLLRLKENIRHMEYRRIRHGPNSVSVRGTDFIMVAEGEVTHIYLGSGKLEISNTETGGQVTLSGSQQLTLGGNSGETHPQPLAAGDFEERADGISAEIP